jgi:hypothetical protein
MFVPFDGSLAIRSSRDGIIHLFLFTDELIKGSLNVKQNLDSLIPIEGTETYAISLILF